MALRWRAGMREADHRFRRVNGHLHLPKLGGALDACFTGNVKTGRTATFWRSAVVSSRTGSPGGW